MQINTCNKVTHILSSHVTMAIKYMVKESLRADSRIAINICHTACLILQMLGTFLHMGLAFILAWPLCRFLIHVDPLSTSTSKNNIPQGSNVHLRSQITREGTLHIF
jgi:hypothetical protein